MIIFNIISLLGGLAMFLYGMRLMSSNLRDSSSGALKKVMEKVTNNPIKAFFLGLVVTAIIQSSTATIVITSGLVAAGIITLDQSLGIIIGANVGTTVTGQIIRLLDLNAGENPILQMFKPSTLAPVALIIGIILIMFCKFSKSDSIGGIAIGFGILFSGLLNMTDSVSVLTENGLLDGVFSGLDNNPFLGYITGATVSFILQSSSATVGILQAFALSGGITFGGLYAILVGIYLGDCVTTAIVCSIGAKADAKRVGLVNIMYNLGKSFLVLVGVNIVHAFGLLNSIWSVPITSGGIANTNTIFNIVCAVVMLPLMKLLAKLSRKLVKDSVKSKGKYADKIDSLNPVFFRSPALALRSCYDILRTMLLSAHDNINKAIMNVENYDQKRSKEISDEERNIDMLADNVSKYLAQLSSHLNLESHTVIFEQYFKLVSDFERMGDYALNIDELAQKASEEERSFSPEAIRDLSVVKELLEKIFSYTETAFRNRDIESAYHIEPLEEVMDDLIGTLHDNHIARLRDGKCTVALGTLFMDILSNIERISDSCSNVGVSVIARVHPEKAGGVNAYISSLHNGSNEQFNREYREAYDAYFQKIKNLTDNTGE